MVRVSVAIPTYNRKEKLRRLLYSLKQSTFTDYEIIVVDDASTDGTQEMIKEEFPDVKYIRHEKPTLVAKSRNDAIEISEGEFIFFIDDDNVVEKDTIEKLYNYASTHEEVGGVAPVTCYYNNPEKVQYAGIAYSKFIRRGISLYTNCNCKDLEGKVIEVVTFGNSYMLRKDVIKKSGLIPWKRIPWAGEDGYLHYKMKKLGYKNVTLGSARVYHDQGITTRLDEIKRYNEMRLYYSLRSKIVFVLDLDPLPQRISFLISLPLYVGHYGYIGLKAKGFNGLRAVFVGLIDGLRRSEELKYVT